jgi:hypothetical protein
MKKVVISLLLVAAAGTGVFYLLQKKKEDQPSFTKDIVGKWAMDSLAGPTTSPDDSLLISIIANAPGLNKKTYEFLKNDVVVLADATDSIPTSDTTTYSLYGKNGLLLKYYDDDPAPDSLTIIQLDTARLVIMNLDSITMYFKRIK